MSPKRTCTPQHVHRVYAATPPGELSHTVMDPRHCRYIKAGGVFPARECVDRMEWRIKMDPHPQILAVDQAKDHEDREDRQVSSQKISPQPLIESPIERFDSPLGQHTGKDLIKSSLRAHEEDPLIGNYKLKWEDGPRTILIIKKPNDEQTDNALIDVASWIHSQYPQVNVVVEPDVAEEFADLLPFVYSIPEGKRVEYTRVTDLVITLGGDGTILHISSLFNSAVPPVISFSMGTLGFLLPYHINNYKSALQKLIENCHASLLLRMRLKCTLHGADGRRLQAKDGSGRINDLTVMNEVNLHRGRYPHLTSIGCFVDGHLITEAVADGLIVASPTGSTAYSLSAGGSIVHPSIQSLLLTPICPRSLSFRPVLLPPNATIQLKIGEKSRGPAEVSLDGKETFFLDKNEFLQVCMSPFPMPCVNRVHAGEDWIKDINDLLNWNKGFHNKQTMSHYMSE
ncbi:NADH kinase pos5 [Mortierella alpina]|nr:NADH kinase pos5 [Mortierella alpina]